jgi:hypothetical protein
MDACREWQSVLRGAVVFLLMATAAAHGQELVGKGEWQSLSGTAIKGTWVASLTRAGDQVAGTLTLTGSNVFTGGSVLGDIDTASIMLGVMAAGAKQASFSARIDGESIKGEWECDAVKDHGVWWGTLTPRTAEPVAGAEE